MHDGKPLRYFTYKVSERGKERQLNQKKKIKNGDSLRLITSQRVKY